MGTLRFIRVPSLLKCYWSSECKWAGLRKGQLDLKILLNSTKYIIHEIKKMNTVIHNFNHMCVCFVLFTCWLLLESRKGT